MLLYLLLYNEVKGILIEQGPELVGITAINLLNTLTIAGLDCGLDDEVVISSADSLNGLIEVYFLSVTIIMAVDILYDGEGLFHLREQLAIDVLIQISVLEIMTVKCRNHIEVIYIHRQVTVAVNATQTREIVIKHHRDLESLILIISREFLLVSLVVKAVAHDVVLEIPVTPVILLVGIDIFCHRITIFNK
jgi:hypothetical protein